MWDGLHFILIDVSVSEPIGNNLLSEAVVGATPIDEVEEYIAYTEKTKIKEMLVTLENFDIENAMENFSIEENDYYVDAINEIIEKGKFISEESITDDDFENALTIDSVFLYLKGRDTSIEIDSNYEIEFGGMNR